MASRQALQKSKTVERKRHELNADLRAGLVLAALVIVVFGIAGVTIGTNKSSSSNSAKPTLAAKTTVPSPVSKPAAVTPPPNPIPAPVVTPAPAFTPSPSPVVSDGFQAGYDYADQYQICDPNYANGNSDDFNAGVNQWTQDNQDTCNNQ